jgi:hypothetical protein
MPAKAISPEKSEVGSRKPEGAEEKATLTEAQIAELVSEGAALAPIAEAGRKAGERLDQIKAVLRELTPAGEKAQYAGMKGEVATVSPVKDGIARSVPEELVAKVKELCGRALGKLFKLGPCKEFELSAFKTLEKKEAAALVELLRLPSSARVSFTPPPALKA